MNWLQARRLLRKATGRSPAGRAVGGRRTIPPRGPIQRQPQRVSSTPRVLEEFAAVRAGSICIASGKGGTGKSVLTASLAQLCATRGRTLVMDADLGVGNAHILQDVSPETSFVDVVDGRLSARDILCPCGPRVDLLPAGSGFSRMAELALHELHFIASGIEVLEREYRYLLVDSAAGLSSQTLSFAAAADLVLVVTTPDLTALTDAYAFLKVLLGRRPDCEPLLVVNRVENGRAAQQVADRLDGVARRFLRRAPRYLGWLPDDPAVTRSVNHRGPVVSLEPACPWARSARSLSVDLLDELSRRPARGLGRELSRRTCPSTRTA